MCSRPSQALKSSDHAHAARMGRPHRERDAWHPVHLAYVRAELLVGSVVTLLAPEVQIEIADGGQKAVRLAQA